MVRISTRFDTFYDKELDANVKRKVFVVRGDEAYARTTETTIELNQASIVTGAIEGLKIPSMKILLKRTVGNGRVQLFDGDNPSPLYEANTTSSTHEVTITNLYLAYGSIHKLWARYIPLQSQCLPSKTKKTDVYRELPASLKVNFIKTSADVQIYPTDPLTFTFNVKVGSSNAPTTLPVNVYINDDLVDTLNPDGSGNITMNSTFYELIGEDDPVKGKYSVKLDVENSDAYWGNTYEYDVSVGHSVEIIEYPSYFANGVTSTFKARIYDWFGNSVSNGTAYLNKGSTNITSSTTFTDGIVTFQCSGDNMTDGGYNVSYGTHNKSDLSQTVTIGKISPTGMTISASPMFTAYGSQSVITAQLNSTPISGLPITFSYLSTNKTSYTDSNGKASITYDGTGAGTFRVSASYGDVTHNTTIPDYEIYFANGQKYNMDRIQSFRVTTSSYNNYIIYDGKGSNSIIEFNPHHPLNPFELRFTLYKLDTKTIEFGNYNGSFDSNTLSFNLESQPNTIHIRVEYDYDAITLKVGNETVASISQSVSRNVPFMKFYGENGVGSSIRIGNLTLMRTTLNE